LLHDAFFAVSNLACQGFFTADGKIVTMALAPGDRAPFIKFVLFEATVRPTATSPDLHAVPPAVVSFYLQLPQSLPPIDDAQLAVEDGPVETSPPPADPVMAKLLRDLQAGAAVSALDLQDASVATALATLLKRASTPAVVEPAVMFTIQVHARTLACPRKGDVTRIACATVHTYARRTL
jgi:hypothetical protein